MWGAGARDIMLFCKNIGLFCGSRGLFFAVCEKKETRFMQRSVIEFGSLVQFSV